MGNPKSYAVGIPTRGRCAILGQTILALVRQTLPPSLILLINNNDEDEIKADGMLIKQIQDAVTEDLHMEWVECDYDVPGIIQGDQTALRIFTERGYGIAARWDDDLIPKPDCIEKLVKLIDGGYLAAGGMYPGPDGTSPEMGPGYSHMEHNGPIGANGSKRHLQFWAWKGEHRIIERHFLYSSFVYNVRAANDIGGFCTDYSQHSYRADTDFTLRLNQKGKLAVDTSAVAIHRWCSGGIRGIDKEEGKKMRVHDLLLFGKRMRALGIDPDY